MNVNRTKGMTVDLRKTKIKSNSISIMGEVEMVEENKYLGVHLDNKLVKRCNTNSVYKRGQSRLYFFKKFRSSSVCSSFVAYFL